MMVAFPSDDLWFEPRAHFHIENFQSFSACWNSRRQKLRNRWLRNSALFARQLVLKVTPFTIVPKIRVFKVHPTKKKDMNKKVSKLTQHSLNKNGKEAHGLHEPRDV